jgi:hypothetical protein
MNPESVIVNGGYLVRSVSVDGSSLKLQADFNASVPIEIIGVPKGVSTLVLNDEKLQHTTSDLGNWIAHPELGKPEVKLPKLSSLKWKQIDSLPEAKADYDDSAWTIAANPDTNNTLVPLLTPVSLYSSDYGYHIGALIYRGHFTSHGTESELRLWTQGGEASASSVWLNGEFLGSFKGFDYAKGDNTTFPLPKLTRGKKYVITVAIDTNGLH